MDIVSRFWNLVSTRLPGQCWLWSGQVTDKGFGAFYPEGKKRVSVHRFSYELSHGPIAEGVQIGQTCGNKTCVNPDHLCIAVREKPLEDRFWALVGPREPGKCWLWLGGRNKKGYGRFSSTHGKNWGTHRLAYVMAFGPIADDICVLHKCDVRTCVNPEHLFLGTNADNTDDMVNKGRLLKGEQTSWAVLTEADVIEIRREIRTKRTRQAVLAVRFNVAVTTISQVKTGRIWGHVTSEPPIGAWK